MNVSSKAENILARITAQTKLGDLDNKRLSQDLIDKLDEDMDGGKDREQ